EVQIAGWLDAGKDARCEGHDRVPLTAWLIADPAPRAQGAPSAAAAESPEQQAERLDAGEVDGRKIGDEADTAEGGEGKQLRREGRFGGKDRRQRRIEPEQQQRHAEADEEDEPVAAEFGAGGAEMTAAGEPDGQHD